jgi:pimeloyl-ACP methyl ester carboxylesterase
MTDSRLSFETRGDAGPRVILVHGSGTDRHTWDAVLPFFASRCRVTAYDRRGGDEANDLAALIEQLHAAPVHVVGSGSGSDIALELIVERPDLFASASLHEPALSTVAPADLSSFGAPLLLTYGDQSPTSRRDKLDDIADVLPRAQRYIFRGAGYAPHLTNPDDYALVVGSFINGVQSL